MFMFDGAISGSRRHHMSVRFAEGFIFRGWIKEDSCAAAAAAAARKELAEAGESLIAQMARLEAVEASARRNREEFKAVKDRVDRVLLGMRQLAEDPSAADHSVLDEHLRDGQEATARLRELVRAYQTVDREIAALKYEQRLTRGRVTAAKQLLDLELAFEELKCEAATHRAAAAAVETDVSSGDHVEGETAVDHD
ncbi:unnamed protein product [Urochloa humidicola]